MNRGVCYVSSLLRIHRPDCAATGVLSVMEIFRQPGKPASQRGHRGHAFGVRFYFTEK